MEPAPSSLWVTRIDDIINGIITAAMADEPIEGLYVDNGQVVDADCAVLQPDAAGVIRALLPRTPIDSLFTYVIAKTTSVTGSSTRGISAQYVTPTTQRYLTLNPNSDLALPYGASVVNFTADGGESGAVTSWRWPLDATLRSTIPEAFPVYYDVSQVSFALNGPTATIQTITPFCSPLPLFAAQIYVTQSGWSNSPSTTNVAHYQGTSITTPSNSNSATGLVYDSLPMGVLHIAIGWRDYNGTQQHAYMKVNPFTTNANERCRITMLFASKTVTFASDDFRAAQTAYFDNLNRYLCPAKLSPGYIVNTTTTTAIPQEYTAGSTNGLTTLSACGAVTVRCLYEGPENNIAAASSSQYNPVTVRVVLRPLSDLQHYYSAALNPCSGKKRRPICSPANALASPGDPGTPSTLRGEVDPTSGGPNPPSTSNEVVIGYPPSNTPSCPNCVNISPKPVFPSPNTGARGGTFHSF